jgi:hypothetical protein
MRPFKKASDKANKESCATALRATPRKYVFYSALFFIYSICLINHKILVGLNRDLRTIKRVER